MKKKYGGILPKKPPLISKVFTVSLNMITTFINDMIHII